MVLLSALLLASAISSQLRAILRTIGARVKPPIWSPALNSLLRSTVQIVSARRVSRRLSSVDLSGRTIVVTWTLSEELTGVSFPLPAAV